MDIEATNDECRVAADDSINVDQGKDKTRRTAMAILVNSREEEAGKGKKKKWEEIQSYRFWGVLLKEREKSKINKKKEFF